MAVYMIQQENPLKSGTMIEAIDGVERIPAVLVSSSRNGFPVEAGELAENFASLLNGAHPPHALNSGGALIHYFKHANGVTLQHRKPGAEGGISVEGLQLTVLDTIPERLRGDLMAKVTPDLMQTLCNGIDMKVQSPTRAATVRKSDFNF